MRHPRDRSDGSTSPHGGAKNSTRSPRFHTDTEGHHESGDGGVNPPLQSPPHPTSERSKANCASLRETCWGGGAEGHGVCWVCLRIAGWGKIRG